MSFFTGFEKSASVKDVAKSLGGILGRGRGRTLGTAAAVGKEVKETGKAFGKSFSGESTQAYRKALGKKEVGKNLAKTRVMGEEGSMAEKKKLMPKASEKARAQIQARAERLKDFKEKHKPTFVEKHPYVTAGGALVAGKMLFGEKERDQSQPQVVSPQY